jgi:TetR/AcrR family transcriptional regulator, fatty acid metabolism regulator protein
MEKQEALAEVLQVELRQSNKFMKEYEPKHFFEYLDLIAEIVREGQAAGLVRTEVTPDIFKRALFGALDEISLHWVLRNRNRNYLETSAAQLGEIFLKGIVKEGIKI